MLKNRLIRALLILLGLCILAVALYHRIDNTTMSDIYRSECNPKLFEKLEYYHYTQTDKEISESRIERTIVLFQTDESRVGGIQIILERNKQELSFVSSKCIP